ncbi:Helicase protein with RING/U-box domain [Gossypium australe]|uniref:Helicase protein with RING/U-box domain n=1 Tax=Gossypium australe TaxID=47621 RepID=A0A5B6UCA4_9ROSI|nr:Helicase protein with RING/U-box domain [Gossypium australe]
MKAMDIDTVEEKKSQEIQSSMDNNVVSVVKLLPKDPDSNLHAITVSRIVTATGFRVSTLIGSGDQFGESDPVQAIVKEEPLLRVKEEPDLGFDSDASMRKDKVIKVKEEPGLGFGNEVRVKEEMGFNQTEEAVAQKEDSWPMDTLEEFLPLQNAKVQSLNESRKIQIKKKASETAELKSNNQNPPCAKKEPDFECSQKRVDVKKEVSQERKVNGVLVEDEDFPEDPDWYLVGRTIVNAVSTTKGKNKLLDNEIVYFTFPSPAASYKLQSIVRFSTKRCGEDGYSEVTAALPAAKRRRGCQEQNKDEQDISEASLNKIVGAADTYDLEEMEPPHTLMCKLRSYQKQALYWMSGWEKGIDAEKAAQTLHPCWSAYRICDERASSIYVNVFSGEATVQFPSSRQMARGGILADAMGLGKTVMTIALILSRLGRGNPDNEKPDSRKANGSITTNKKRDTYGNAPRRAKGGTLIICPMALLSQWKDELETHSRPETISIFVHYGGDRTSDPRVISEHDVVLTTYGVLTAAYKSDAENSIYHRVDWYRVVLDEAHAIKSSKTLGARACFALSAHCRWCLTGTPLQNNLEDLYSLLCFLHVEPWCNWAWWKTKIQGPYENGNPTGLKWIKAILRLLMLRRTKETKDKEGRPILVLPPTDIQVIECEQSEAERDFYDALFKRSKVQFDQFVAQGRVLHNYASILELLLRLRQCCNHPFLVMSRADSQQYSDLNKLARRFLEAHPGSVTLNQNAPTKAYIEEVVDGIRRGENTECPICMESADDPVLTPCAHRMCRECLLSSWRTPTLGSCPICRTLLKKTDLITCPTENKFRVDIDKNWKESSKVSKLLDCLERSCRSGSGEKSIVFSQWTSFLDLLEIPLKRKGIGFLRFDGKLAQKQRERVLKEFNDTREKLVLLMSLKAGGVGLNLTAASNVFLMDPWWNPAVEEQAIMRIHRIGQKRTVTVRRFIVKETVEERMQQVQARKEKMIAGALTDEEVRSARIEELKMLFR